jgi:copper chaperone CopZ
MNFKSSIFHTALLVIAVAVLSFWTVPAILARVKLEARQKACHQCCVELRQCLKSTPGMADVEVSVSTGGQVLVLGRVMADAEPKLIAAIKEARRTNPAAMSFQLEEAARPPKFDLRGETAAGEELRLTHFDFPTEQAAQ